MGDAKVSLPPPPKGAGLRSCLKDPELSAIKSMSPKDPLLEKRVRFDPSVRVAMLPAEQRVDARKARMGLWKPGPPHDELWDGDLLDFREVELTPEEFKQLMKRMGGKRTSLPRTLQKVQRLFSVATDKLSLPITARFGGVDVVGARARLSEDFDEDERDESSVGVSSAGDGKSISDKEADVSPVRRASNVRISYVNFESGGSAPPSPTRRASTTKFDPSPPSGPSPSERYAMSLASSKTEEERGSSESSASLKVFALNDEQPEQNKKVESSSSVQVVVLNDEQPEKALNAVCEPVPAETEQPVEKASSIATRKAEPTDAVQAVPTKQTITLRPTSLIINDIEVPFFVVKFGAALVAILMVHLLVFRITIFRILMLGTVAVLGFIGYHVISTHKPNTSMKQPVIVRRERS